MMDAMPSRAKVDGEEKPRDHHVCPWWVGYLITNPIRKLGEDPDKILAPHVRSGMTVIDIGCGMGFFSLPVARMVGNTGRVVCIDVQQKMLSSLLRRAGRKGLGEIVEPRLATQEDPGLDDLEGAAHLVLAIHVLHETAFPRRFLARCHETLRPGGRMMLIEPNGHVSNADFEASIELALEVGLREADSIELSRSRGIVFAKSK